MGSNHAHAETCTHHHLPAGNGNEKGRYLLLAILMNLLIPVVQLTVGFHAQSMALISDATHNFSDLIALVTAYAAMLAAGMKPSSRYTFGYQRIEALAALFNTLLLVGASVFIAYHSFQRMLVPTEVAGLPVIACALFAVIGNGISAWTLHKGSSDDLNVRGAFLHMLGDTLFSVAVLVNGIILSFKPWYWLDPLVSFIIVAFILFNCFSLIRAAVRILMNAAPPDLDVSDIKTALTELGDVLEVHHLHAWHLGSSETAFSCHVVIEDRRLSEVEPIADRVRELLRERFAIMHPVLQFETRTCGEGNLLCDRHN